MKKKKALTPKQQAIDIINYCKARSGNQREILEMVLLCGERLEEDIGSGGDEKKASSKFPGVVKLLDAEQKAARMRCANYLQRYACTFLGYNRKLARETRERFRKEIMEKDASVFDPDRDL